LKTNETYDLVVLKELIVKMSGMEANEDATADQRAALCGGPTLRQQAGSFVVAEAKGSANEKKLASTRLRNALCKKDIGMPLLVLISQQLGSVIFGTTAKLHMKLISTLNDQCQETLVQLSDFMQKYLTSAEYAEMIPSLTTMCKDFNLDTNVAFHVLRPKYTATVSAAIDAVAAETTEASSEAAHVALASVVDESVKLFPTWDWKNLPSSLCVTFWSLSM
jgi:THO complex subunit 2